MFTLERAADTVQELKSCMYEKRPLTLRVSVGDRGAQG